MSNATSFNTTTNSTKIIPERTLSENVEICALSVLTMIAVMINARVMIEALLGKGFKLPSRINHFLGGFFHNSFEAYKFHLWISDFLILFIYSLGKIIWLITFEWMFGRVGCKVYKFMSSFSFYASSLLVMAISIDRVICVHSTHVQGVTSLTRCRYLLVAVWVIAALAATPQLFLWTTVRVDSGWVQCVSTFTLETNELIAKGGQEEAIRSLKRQAVLYEIFYQCMAFWIPLVIILGSYLSILVKLSPMGRSDSLLLRKRSEVREKSQLSSGSEGTRVLEVSSDDATARTISHSNTHHSRKQLGGKVFSNACRIVVAHICLWLPYSILSGSRFINEEFYLWAMEHGGNLLEDLIVLNALINPLLYTDRPAQRTRRLGDNSTNRQTAHD